jgi:hypothetical protein
MNPIIFNPWEPNKLPPPSVQRKIDAKHGEDAIVSVNVSIRDEKASDTKEVLRETLAYLDREFGGSHYA